MSLIFCNPERSDGWVQVGLIIPGSESSERQHFRLHRTKHEEAVRSLYKTFDSLWNNGIATTPEEDMEEGFSGETKKIQGG